jgi:hypothetical protein
MHQNVYQDRLVAKVQRDGPDLYQTSSFLGSGSGCRLTAGYPAQNHRASMPSLFVSFVVPPFREINWGEAFQAAQGSLGLYVENCRPEERWR